MGISSVDHHHGVTALHGSASSGPACGPAGVFFPILGILLRLPKIRFALSWHGLPPQIRSGPLVIRGTRFFHSLQFLTYLGACPSSFAFSHEAGVIISWFMSGSPYLHGSFLFRFPSVRTETGLLVTGASRLLFKLP